MNIEAHSITPIGWPNHPVAWYGVLCTVNTYEFSPEYNGRTKGMHFVYIKIDKTILQLINFAIGKVWEYMWSHCTAKFHRRRECGQRAPLSWVLDCVK